jgi:hypothetical protein
MGARLIHARSEALRRERQQVIVDGRRGRLDDEHVLVAHDPCRHGVPAGTDCRLPGPALIAEQANAHALNGMLGGALDS